MAKCISCGVENPAGENFCLECGTQLPVEPASAAKGTVVAGGANSEQLSAYKAEAAVILKTGPLNLMSKRRLKLLQKQFCLTDAQSQDTEKEILADIERERAEAAKRQAEEEERKRQEEQARQRAEEERLQKEAEERKRIAEEDAKREAERRAKEAEERKRKAEEKARREAERRAKKAEEEKRKAEEEAKREAERLAKKADEKKRKAEEKAKRKAGHCARKPVKKECKKESEASDLLGTLFVAILVIVLIGFLIWGGWWLVCLLFRHWIITGLVVIGLIGICAAASNS